MSSDEIPERQFMDNPDTRWRSEKPDYTEANKKYLQEKIQNHKPGSLEKIVENLIKTWEMEAAHKEKLEDWGSIDEGFWIQVNGGRVIKAEELLQMEAYNAFLEDCPLYDAKSTSLDASMDLFHSAFPAGFGWELIEVLSGPPRVTFTWRHWAKWEGPYLDQPPTGENVELRGVTIATVNDQLKVKSLEFFFDANPMLAKMGAVKRCPVA